MRSCIFHDDNAVGSPEWYADLRAHGHTVSYAPAEPHDNCHTDASGSHCDCHANTRYHTDLTAIFAEPDPCPAS